MTQDHLREAVRQPHFLGPSHEDQRLWSTFIQRPVRTGLMFINQPVAPGLAGCTCLIGSNDQAH